MLNITMKVVYIRDVERIYVTCEIPSCISDSFQILAIATIENHGLKARRFGNINKRAPKGFFGINGV